jgi:hypothetical protein
MVHVRRAHAHEHERLIACGRRPVAGPTSPKHLTGSGVSSAHGQGRPNLPVLPCYAAAGAGSARERRDHCAIASPVATRAAPPTARAVIDSS